MEAVGGDLNAYTGKEETVYYTTFLKEHFARAIDLLLDITLSSTFPQQEMDKEVEVVIDEIESYNDTPSELIFDEFESLIFQDHPLGRNILGQAELLRQFRSEDVQQFARRLYHPSRMVLFVYGNIPMKRIIREAEKAIGRIKNEKLKIKNCIERAESWESKESLKSMESWESKESLKSMESMESMESVTSQEFPYQPRTTPLPLSHAGVEVRQKGTHQAHVMLGTRGVALHDERHLPLFLLNNILGGPSMNSRLNLALRERNGLVYTVESSLSTYTDTGLWSVYFGCDPDDIDRCLQLVRKELKRLTDTPLSPTALQAYKRQAIGQIGISHDAFESVAINMGKRFLHYGTMQSQERLIQRIQALTPEQIQQTARDIFRPDQLVTLIYK